MSRVAVIWEGEIVGFMEEPMPDMWYLEGRWLPSDNPKTTEFVHAAQSLEAKKTILGGSNLRVELIEEGGTPLPATVLAPLSETIFVRRMANN